jgi:hypothetical protein
VAGAMLVAMAAMFVAALAVPDAFGHHALVFGAAFLIVNLMHIALFALAGRRDADLLAAVLRIAPSTLAGAATSFWLAYFDFFPMRGRQMLEERRGEARTALARDAYTYLHLPMVVGIVLFALAMKETLAHVGDELDTIPALGLLRRLGAVPLRLCGAAPAVVPHRRPRPLRCRSRLRVAVAGRPSRAGARLARAHGRGVDRAARVRDHLVARGSRAYARLAGARLRFLTSGLAQPRRGAAESDRSDATTAKPTAVTGTAR